MNFVFFGGVVLLLFLFLKIGLVGLEFLVIILFIGLYLINIVIKEFNVKVLFKFFVFWFCLNRFNVKFVVLVILFGIVNFLGVVVFLMFDWIVWGLFIVILFLNYCIWYLCVGNNLFIVELVILLEIVILFVVL